MTTIAGFLADRANDVRDGLVFEGRRWTWSEVVQESATRGALLSSLPIRPFHVGVLLENVPEYLFLLGGAALAGATVVGINPTRRGEELARDIRHTDCRLILTDAEHADLLDGLDTGVGPEHLLNVDGPKWSTLLDLHRDAPLPGVLPGRESVWVLIFTSGSTGAPKAVRATQGRMADYGSSLGFGPADVLYCAMPLFHGNALNANVIPAMAGGATIAMRRRFSATQFLADVRDSGSTYFNTVGRALSYILATPPTDEDREHRLKFVLAPESSEADAASFTRRFGVPVVQGYGSSEGAIRMQPVRRARPGALGRPDADADVAVVDAETLTECQVARFDESGRLLNAAEAVGEIVRRDGVSRFEGYYNNDAANTERTRNGWFWSGDLAYRDSEGIFYFAGRTADWLRVDGENFGAAPVERIIERHPEISAVAVYGVPDPVTGDQVMAAVELLPGTSLDGAGLATFLAAQPDLGTKWSPRFVRVMDALPETATGKIDKRPLRALVWRPPGEVWWRPGGTGPYQLLSESECRKLDAELARNGRSELVEHPRDFTPHV
ncbi:MAG: AMP-binding protein [Acidimicrobiales bacterium]